MSVASVLERSGNVRDVREVTNMRENFIWDRITGEDILDNFYNCWGHIPFLGFDVISYPGISGYKDYFLKITSESSIDNSNMNHDKYRTEYFMNHLAMVRFLEIDLSEDFKDDRELLYGKNKLKEIEDECLKGSPGTQVLDYIFSFKVCYPSEDVNSVIDSLLVRYQNVIEKSLTVNYFYSNEQYIRKLRDLAILKLLKPTLFEKIYVKDSELYNEVNLETEHMLSLNGSFDPEIIKLSSYLKFFAAEKAVLGPHGIELTMPKSLALPSSPTLPEIGRFDV